MPSKIEKYGFQDRVLKLYSEPGMTSLRIAQVLTEELQGNDSISQPTVSRWLKDVRDERREETRQVVNEHIKANIPKDLEALDIQDIYALTLNRLPPRYVQEGTIVFNETVKKEEIERVVSESIKIVKEKPNY